MVFVLFEFENSGFAVPGDSVLRSGCIYGYALRDATKSSIWMMKNMTPCRISGLVGILPGKSMLLYHLLFVRSSNGVALIAPGASRWHVDGSIASLKSIW